MHVVWLLTPSPKSEEKVNTYVLISPQIYPCHLQISCMLNLLCPKYAGESGGACDILVLNYWSENGAFNWRVKHDYAKVFLDSTKQDMRITGKVSCDRGGWT